jgi:hypothetical protein
MFGSAEGVSATNSAWAHYLEVATYLDRLAEAAVEAGMDLESVRAADARRLRWADVCCSGDTERMVLDSVLPDRSFRQRVETLCEFEGRRCLWRVPVAAATYLLARVIPFATAITLALITVKGRVATAIVSVGIGLSFDALSGRVRQRFPWSAVVDNRLRTYEDPNVSTHVEILLPIEQAALVRAALRRAKLNPSQFSARIGSPISDAPDLTLRLGVQEPKDWAQSSSDAERIARIVAALRDAETVRARVNGTDVFPRESDLAARRDLVASGGL